MPSVNEIRSHYLDYFERNGHTRVPSSPLVPRNDPDAPVHQRRHGPVQGLLHRPLDPDLPARDERAEVRARRRQAQRPRQRRLHRPASHLLRDAGELLVRRLFQGSRDRARLRAGDARLRPRQGQAVGDGASVGRGSAVAVEEDRRLQRRPDHRPPGQPLGDGRHRSVRLLLRDLLRPGTVAEGRTARQSGRGRRPLPRILEPGVHAVRAGRRHDPHRPAAPVDRHRHGAGAHHRDHAGRPQQLRHRPVQDADRGVGRCGRRAGRGRAGGEPPRHRRSPPRLRLPDRRRRAAVERGPRLCAAPHHAARHAPRASARDRGAADVPAGADARRRNGRARIPSWCGRSG